MIYGKNAEKSCRFCAYSSYISVKGDLLCSKKGIVSESQKCLRFKYEPQKRDIFPKPKLQTFEKSEFQI